jgi:hypothetical protein
MDWRQNDMKVLIACEESQVVCKAFRAKGHEAYSCDIIDCSGGRPEWHIKGDVVAHLKEVGKNYYDMILAFSPCTYNCNSGVCHLIKDGKLNFDRYEKMVEMAVLFNFFDEYAPKVAKENPIPHKYARAIIGKYDQIVQPYMFGHPERKATCLWLKGLSKLTETNNVKEEMLKLPKNKQQRLHYLPPSKNRTRLRSTTFPGFADAMADQWG